MYRCPAELRGKLWVAGRRALGHVSMRQDLPIGSKPTGMRSSCAACLISRAAPAHSLESGERIRAPGCVDTYGENDEECLALASHGARPE